ncbi:MAG: acyltransferase family protein [Phycisphaera sp.]|nr:acyltransferase family protein [Phycisphaera sp.]
MTDTTSAHDPDDSAAASTTGVDPAAHARHGKGRVHFGGLTALRGIAAMCVVVHHIELYNERDGYFSLYDTPLKPVIHVMGGHAVEVFFVLSGFLITYLLRRERVTTGGISLKAFWARRVLRI